MKLVLLPFCPVICYLDCFLSTVSSTHSQPLFSPTFSLIQNAYQFKHITAWCEETRTESLVWLWGCLGNKAVKGRLRDVSFLQNVTDIFCFRHRNIPLLVTSTDDPLFSVTKYTCLTARGWLQSAESVRTSRRKWGWDQFWTKPSFVLATHQFVL
jgi:hypothetical protein